MNQALRLLEQAIEMGQRELAHLRAGDLDADVDAIFYKVIAHIFPEQVESIGNITSNYEGFNL